MEKPKNVKTKIFESAVELFSTRGYHGTSMRDLAKTVGIKESSIYNHYTGKSAILDAILNYQIAGFQKAVTALEAIKIETEDIHDPVEFWLAGARVFIANQAPLSETISRILINEMFLNKQCRDFYLGSLFTAQKELTESILQEMHW